MSRYLKDDTLRDLTITKECLDILNKKILALAEVENAAVKTKNSEPKVQEYYQCRVEYVLRADGKGVKYEQYDSLKEDFNTGKKIERLVITLVSNANISSNSAAGKRLSVKFDSVSGEATYLVEDDDNQWVETASGELSKILEKFGNRNSTFYSWWFVYIIQLFGVFCVFLLSLLFSYLVAPYLRIDYALLFSFVVFFLVFSNLWTHCLEGIKWLVERYFPRIYIAPERPTEKWMPEIAFALMVTLIIWIATMLWGHISCFLFK